MPFSFIDIEERKTKQIILVFVFLLLFYFLGAWVLAITGHALFLLRFSRITSFKQIITFSPEVLLLTFGVAFTAGIFHWIFSTHNNISRILQLLRAEIPDKEDKYHHIFQNIVEEVCIATGGKRIECVVLPFYGMNAFSIADYNGHAVIGVTEGLLSRLNRTQLEAVIAHEAAHVLIQDTLLKTIAVSLFGVYDTLCEQIKNGMSGVGTTTAGSHIYMAVLYIVSSLIYALTKFVSIFISRQCEYRADAIAVRLVRDPLSLAQALYLISSKWRGGGMGYDSMESLFIMNPNYHTLDESEGVIANLFSTHPPIKNRISILLDMGHSNFNILEKEAKGVKKPRYTEIKITKLREPRWYIMSDIKWEGPFSIKEIIGLEWVHYNSFVRREGTNQTIFLYNDQNLFEVFRKGKCKVGSIYFCPHCCKPLNKILYEGTPLYRCDTCAGVLIEQKKIPRIIIRKEQGFSEEVIWEAKLVKALSKKPFSLNKVKMKQVFSCPKCKRIMTRKLYSLAYPIEVDFCTFCKMTWFDKHEMEILQYLVEEASDY